jgi:hypothetical protein
VNQAVGLKRHASEGTQHCGHLRAEVLCLLLQLCAAFFERSYLSVESVAFATLTSQQGCAQGSDPDLQLMCFALDRVTSCT